MILYAIALEWYVSIAARSTLAIPGVLESIQVNLASQVLPYVGKSVRQSHRF
jgi:hypothetical protein